MGAIFYAKANEAWQEICLLLSNEELDVIDELAEKLEYSQSDAVRVFVRNTIAGDLAVKPVSEDVSVKIDSGTIYITNKRVIFRGTNENKTIKLPKILNISPYANGIRLEKDATIGVTLSGN